MCGNWKWTQNPLTAVHIQYSSRPFLTLSWLLCYRKHLQMNTDFTHETCIQSQVASPLRLFTYLWLHFRKHISECPGPNRREGNRTWCQNVIALSQWMQNGISNKYNSKTYGPLAATFKNQSRGVWEGYGSWKDLCDGVENRISKLERHWALIFQQ